MSATESQPSVLVVDDRPANRYVIVHTLRRAGFHVVEASTGREALELAGSLPKAIVLDVKLPDILGYEVCRRLKANASTTHIPVLQLSAAFLSDESKVHALESGADAFLTQPVDPNVLLATVKGLVRLHDAEAQSRQLAAQWQATFDALGEGIALVDSAGIVKRCNRAMTGFLQRTYAQIERASLSDLMYEIFAIRIEAGNSVFAREVQLRSRYFRLSQTPVIVADSPSGTICILSEITEQKRAQAALVFNEGLVSTGRMANTIAHEINNPLEAITNLLYLLDTMTDPSSLSGEYLAAAQEQLSRVSRIARQILSFNRESASMVSVNVPELLEDVLALNNKEIQRKGITVEKDWSGEYIVEAFPAQLRQVFLNLLRNAVEASDRAQVIRIRISRSSQWGQQNEPAVRISFADHGAGIQPEHIVRIFEAFFTTKALKGSGIGLWLSANIVEEHRGSIRVRSCATPPGTGTCMSVTLPVSHTAN